MKNILLLQGGGSTEHEISLISAKYIESKVDQSKFKVYKVEISKNFEWLHEGVKCELNHNRELILKDQKLSIHALIPCLHGYPGETGDIQSYCQLINLPYLGCNSETSVLCFNKLVTKLMLESAGVKTTPFIQVSKNESDLANNFLSEHKSIFVKATNQGSSVGCYLVNDKQELKEKIAEAFKFSPYVILEKNISGRELEVAAYEYKGNTYITPPGEIRCPNHFYSYEEKYSKTSHTQTDILAKDIDQTIVDEINRQSKIAWSALKLRHMARIDFFLSSDGEIFINEVNTFPGHTSISMFPSMMERDGVSYSDFINDILINISL